jgi:S1-C subfamily serine protease
VVVELRLPGFAASRFLRDGDIILAISTDGAAMVPVHSSRDIMDPVSRLRAGQQVRLQIIRHGRRIEKTLTLDARPRELEQRQAALTFESFRKMQDQKAEDFWSAHFAAVVGDSIS